MEKTFIKFIVSIVLSLFFSVFGLNAEESVYRSNSIGQTLKKLKFYQIDEHDWILRVSRNNLVEDRKLFFKEELKKEWSIKYYRPGKMSWILELDNGVKKQEIFYNISGNEVEERNYTQGELNRKILFFYDKEQRIKKKENFNKDDELLFTEYYEIGSQGQIRSIEQRWGENSFQRSSFVMGKKGLVQEIYESNQKTTVIRYDSSGNVSVMESYEGDRLIDRIDYLPSEEGKYKTIKKLSGSDSVQERIFNDKSQLVKEILKKGDKIESQWLYQYNDDDLIIKKQYKGPQGLLQESFSYDDENELLEHDFFERGSLVKRISYSDDLGRVEVYFRKGQKILSVYFQDEKKVKEEIFENGELIKERSFE